MILVIRFTTTTAIFDVVVGGYSDAFNLIIAMIDSASVLSWTIPSGISPSSLGWDPYLPKYVLPF